jgi:hypothetical protein
MSGHEDLCAERYKTINKTLGYILQVLGWGGAALILILITAVGALYNQQVTASRTRTDSMNAQLQNLQGIGNANHAAILGENRVSPPSVVVVQP